MESLVTALTSLFTVANTLTPLAIIALLVGLFYVLLWKMPQQLPSKAEVATIRDNHLHEMPEVAANMRQAVETLRRMEVSQEKHFGIIISKLEGKR